MKIAVCIKQVPNIAAMKFNPETRTLVREGVPLEVSAFDIRALLKAIDLAKPDGEVVAITMGPPQAAKALEHCLALGAHRAIHLCDRAFAGSDTLATARALALALDKETFDLIFCGRYSVDAETGQVGPELAELLDLPQATAVRSIVISADQKTATVERETDDGYETLEVQIPFLLTAAEDLAPERFPGKKDREAAKTKTIKTLTAADLATDLTQFGQAGSPTWVKEVTSVSSKRTCVMIEGDSAAAKIEKLGVLLRERRKLSTWNDPPLLGSTERPISSDRAVWVVAELLGPSIRRVTLELLGRGLQLAAKLRAPLEAVLVGHPLQPHADLLCAHGADRVLVADHPSLASYRTEPFAGILADAIRTHRPHSALIPSTSMGRDLAPRVAARLGLGLTGDCIGLDLDEAGNLVMMKPAFGGNIVAPVMSKTFPHMATVRPGILKAGAPNPGRRPSVTALPTEGADRSRTRLLGSKAEGSGEAAALDSAEIVVGFGMGIGGPEQLPKIRALAKALGAPLATTRDVTDKGWLPRQHQVGLTGRAIAPRVYFAIGIRGAFEHTVGIQKAGTIVAINNDDQAQIWECADFGVKGDWVELVAALTQAVTSSNQLTYPPG